MIPPIIKSRPGYVVIAVGTLVVGFIWLVSRSLPRGAVAYSLRPLWDKPEAPNILIPHYYSDQLETEQLCRLHGWAPRNDSQPRQVWDAVIFSTEIDLLLVRLNELDPVVDKFFILDSDTTFTGNPKPLILPDAFRTTAFRPFLDKIVYSTFQGHPLAPGEDPFHQEGQMRMQMTDILKRNFPSVESGHLAPVMVFSDLDEIPSRRTVELLRRCEFDSPMHLGMRSYLYSFEWEEGGEAESWRPQAWIWTERGQGFEEYYRHGKVTDRILVDSGWHCSWCFRTLAEFVTKAKGYSHVDRLGSRPAALLKPSRIQETICNGLDMFAMLPEAYTYRDFIMKLKLLPSRSALNVPSYIVKHSKQLKYLLPGPGNCMREDAP
ncbi:uncharacterized protein JCM15063_001458 [Sporobolomyces koalae]|uniref:uncharacterized protein n=1 Tax=Sporobolomyces koalae TaxID=500713 RepID=UPI00317BDA5A